jgi:predicted lipoprotein with Yx(FWY)xxD motif
MRQVFAAVALTVALASPAMGQKHRPVPPRPDEHPEIETIATTYRIGKVQYAIATVSVRTVENRDDEIAVEVLNCQITLPIKGEESRGRRTYETTCAANWPIDSEADASMKDFEVAASASSQDIGDLQSKQLFRYTEMHSSRSSNVAGPRGTMAKRPATKKPPR